MGFKLHILRVNRESSEPESDVLAIIGGLLIYCSYRALMVGKARCYQHNGNRNIVLMDNVAQREHIHVEEPGTSIKPRATWQEKAIIQPKGKM